MEKSKKQGVTLVETVVAMALIVIISVATYLTCNFALKHQNNTEIKNFFVQETENVAMSYYKSNNDMQKFDEILAFAFDIEDSSNYFEYENELDENDVSHLKSLTIYYDSDFSVLNLSNKTTAKYFIVFDFENQNISAKHYSKNQVIFQREV